MNDIWHDASEIPTNGWEFLFWYDDGSVLVGITLEMCLYRMREYFCNLNGVPLYKWAYLDDLKDLRMEKKN